MSRSMWGSKLGFILASAGATVGLGSIWKFPYVTAKNGGGLFLLVYVLIVFTLGLALMLAEVSIGRAARTSAVSAFKSLSGKRTWSIVGLMGVVCGFLVFSFYSVVGGWTIGYVQRAIDGRVMNDQPAALAALFQNYVSQPIEPLMTHAIFVTLTLLIVVSGIQKGIERASKILMPALFILMLVLILRALTLPNAEQGLMAFLRPDWSQFSSAMLVDALGLAFFSLSVGAGCMVAYGSYLSPETPLVSASIWVTFLTTLTSILAGLMIFPAVMAFGLDPQAGPGLTYMTMPVVFDHLPFGQGFAIAFFALLLLAALTSSVSMLELIAVYFIDELGWSRKKATICVAAAVFVMGVPASLSFGLLSDVTLFNRNIFDLMDYTASNILLPLGGIGTALFVAFIAWNRLKAELGLSGKIAQAMRFMCGLVAPVLISIILIYNL